MHKIKDLLRESIVILKNAHTPRHGGQASPQLDARVIFEYVLDIGTEEFYKNNIDVSPAQKNKIDKLIAKRAKNEPIAYLLGHKEFFGLDFLVNRSVLIPRPETEELVVKSLNFIRCHSERRKETKNKIVRSFADTQDDRREIAQNDKLNILDMGTGSGCIIISLLHSLEIENCKLKIEAFASDISTDALKVAKKNAKQYQIDNIKFIQSDLFKNIPNQKFDLIIANLPYVPKKVKSEKSKVKSDIDFEPKNAIFAEENGTKIIKRFLLEAKDYININGLILIELDPRNAKEILTIARQFYPNAKIELKKDLAKLDRYLTISLL